MANLTDRDSPDSYRAPRVLRIGFWISIAISVAVVLRRIFALASPARNAPPEMASLDDAFSAHAGLTLAHILPALGFALIAAAIVYRRNDQPAWLNSLFFALGSVVGMTAYAMSAYAIGGGIERSAVLCFNTLFLFSLARAFVYWRKPDPALKRRWQLRSIAILLGIATTRPIMGIFFATSRLTHLVPQQFFGVAFWIGFSVNVLIFELWIRAADRKREKVSAHPSPLRG